MSRQDWRGPQAGWTPTSIGHWEVDVHRAVMVSIDAETSTDGGSLDLPDTGESPERALMRGVVGGGSLGHVAYLVALGALGIWVTSRRLEAMLRS